MKKEFQYMATSPANAAEETARTLAPVVVVGVFSAVTMVVLTYDPPETALARQDELSEMKEVTCPVQSLELYVL